MDSILSFMADILERLLLKRFQRQPLRYLCDYASEPTKMGVYALYDFGAATKLLYVGKVSSKDGVCRRLGEHHTNNLRSVEHDRKLKIEKVVLRRWSAPMGAVLASQIIMYRCLVLDNVWLINSLEYILIKKYNPPLNGSGFGTRTRRSVGGECNWEKLLTSK